MTKGQILLIEDDKDLGESIAENLQLEGYSVYWLQDGLKGLEAAKSQIHDIILLDLMLPNMNGLEILKNLRKISNTPVLIISAKNSIDDKIEGLTLKADDYLTKPFHLKELFLRVEALLRRYQSNTTISDETRTFAINNCQIDFQSLSIQKDGIIERLSDKEAKLLKLFVTKKNQAISRDEILNMVWGYEKGENTRTIDNIILKFRKIFEENPSNPVHFKSIRGVGYMFSVN